MAERTDDDILGIDSKLKVTKRLKVPKIDQDRLLDKTGLPYIVKNHQKLNRILKKRDSQKITNKRHRIDHEYANLSSVLQFYQLWCHTLFPKAKFKDCIQLIRGVVNRSPRLRLYRNELLEQEINKLRVEKGMEVDNFDQDDTEPIDSGVIVQSDDEQENEDESADAIFAFMSGGNLLFVDPDGDDIFTTPNEDGTTTSAPTNAPTNATSVTEPEENPNTNETSNKESEEHKNNASDDDFSDEEAFTLALDLKILQSQPPDIGEQDNVVQDDEELELMNELGL